MNMGIFKNVFLVVVIAVVVPFDFVLAQQPMMVVINEFLPNPVGSDTAGEWMELKNLGEQDISLLGWQVCDKANRCFKFKEERIIAGGFLILDRAQSKISINNSDETLVLLSPNSEIASKISFVGTAKEGQSFSRFGKGDWRWTAVATRGDDNFWPEEKGVEDVEVVNDPEIKKDPNLLGGEKFASEVRDSRGVIFLAISIGILFSALGFWGVRNFLRN